MATDPVPEPLTNQGVSEENRQGFPVAGSPPPTYAGEMPPAPALPPVDGTSGKADRIKSRVSDAAQQAQQAVVEMKNRASEVADQAQQKVAETYDKAKASAARGYEQASRRTAEFARTTRIRSRQIMHDYPFHVIAGAAVVGFLAGVALRIWRSNRYE